MKKIIFILLQHGMGVPSVSILLHEVIKLMYHAKVKNPIFFRIGTCGGIGIEGGNVIITEEALNSDLKAFQEVVSLLSFFSLEIFTIILTIFAVSTWKKGSSLSSLRFCIKSGALGISSRK